LQYHRNQVRPEAKLWLLDDDETLIDLSSGTFKSRIGHKGQAALKEKTSGISGATGSGNEDDGVPNLTIAWTNGDLDVEPGEYTLQIEWLVGSNTPRYWQRKIEILDLVLAPV
jgi:hypothetical protein